MVTSSLLYLPQGYSVRQRDMIAFFEVLEGIIGHFVGGARPVLVPSRRRTGARRSWWAERWIRFSRIVVAEESGSYGLLDSFL